MKASHENWINWLRWKSVLRNERWEHCDSIGATTAVDYPDPSTPVTLTTGGFRRTQAELRCNKCGQIVGLVNPGIWRIWCPLCLGVQLKISHSCACILAPLDSPAGFLMVLRRVRLSAMVHPADKALESLARRTLTTAQSLRLQTHIFHFPTVSSV